MSKIVVKVGVGVTKLKKIVGLFDEIKLEHGVENKNIFRPFKAFAKICFPETSLGSNKLGYSLTFAIKCLDIGDIYFWDRQTDRRTDRQSKF